MLLLTRSQSGSAVLQNAQGFDEPATQALLLTESQGGTSILTFIPDNVMQGFDEPAMQALLQQYPPDLMSQLRTTSYNAIQARRSFVIRRCSCLAMVPLFA